MSPEKGTNPGLGTAIISHSCHRKREQTLDLAQPLSAIHVTGKGNKPWTWHPNVPLRTQDSPGQLHQRLGGDRPFCKESVTKISVQWTIIYCILVYFNILQWLQDLVSPCINMYQLNITKHNSTKSSDHNQPLLGHLRSIEIHGPVPNVLPVPNLDPQRLANLMAFSRAPVSCRLMAVRRRDSTSSICGFSCTAWRFWLCNAMYSLYIQKTSITQ